MGNEKRTEEISLENAAYDEKDLELMRKYWDSKKSFLRNKNRNKRLVEDEKRIPPCDGFAVEDKDRIWRARCYVFNNFENLKVKYGDNFIAVRDLGSSLVVVDLDQDQFSLAKRIEEIEKPNELILIRLC